MSATGLHIGLAYPGNSLTDREAIDRWVPPLESGNTISFEEFDRCVGEVRSHRLRLWLRIVGPFDDGTFRLSQREAAPPVDDEVRELERLDREQRER
jgi:hypothetical protein